MRVEDLRKIMKGLGWFCPKCKSEDTESVSSMTTNVSFTTSETRRCRKCGYTWERYYNAR